LNDELIARFGRINNWLKLETALFKEPDFDRIGPFLNKQSVLRQIKDPLKVKEIVLQSKELQCLTRFHPPKMPKYIGNM
jgi:hypothetical protein